VIGFFLLLVLLGTSALAVCGAYELERISSLKRPSSTHGRLARWTYARRGPLGFILDGIANSRFLGALLEPLPVPVMLSDITDVIYVSYLVPAASLEALVPEGLELQRLGEGGRWALFTFLTYRHGHFGFAFLGPIRKLLFSPIQSNWRIHVRDPRTARQGIYFVTNALSATVPALCARLVSEGMPMHVFWRAALGRDETGRVTLELDPGAGSAPDAQASLAPCDVAPLEGPWRECFGGFRGFLEYCVPQDRAMSTQPWVPRVTRQEIHLGIPLEQCEPLAGEVVSRAAQAIVGDAKPLCFRVAKVSFRLAEEAYDPLPLASY
jgi:hypothetical protein